MFLKKGVLFQMLRIINASHIDFIGIYKKFETIIVFLFDKFFRDKRNISTLLSYSGLLYTLNITSISLSHTHSFIELSQKFGYIKIYSLHKKRSQTESTFG